MEREEGEQPRWGTMEMPVSGWRWDAKVARWSAVVTLWWRAFWRGSGVARILWLWWSKVSYIYVP
jgi:hypothetical protein